MKKSLPYFIIFLISLIFTALKHYEIIPHSVRQPKYYSYNSIFDFSLAVFVCWSIISLVLYFSKREKLKKVDAICPSCELISCVQVSEIGNIICSKCKNSKLVPLSGFYNHKK